jgi:hypothetical protein
MKRNVNVIGLCARICVSSLVCFVQQCDRANMQLKCHYTISSSHIFLPPVFVSPNCMLINKHNYCIFIVLLSIDFPRPHSRISINTIHCWIRRARIHGTRHLPQTLPPQWTRVCCNLSLHFWFSNFFLVFTLTYLAVITVLWCWLRKKPLEDYSLKTEIYPSNI